MPTFEYSAIDFAGNPVNGLVDEADLALASKALTEKGLTVQKLEVRQPLAAPSAPPTEPRNTFRTEVAGRAIQLVSLQSLEFFFSQLGTLLEAGINPVDGLESLARQSNNAILRSVIEECRGHVTVGRPLSVGLQRYPEIFSPLILSLVRVGEEGGMLSTQCKLISEYIHRDIELKNMIRRETMGPKVTVFGSIAIIVGVNGFLQIIAPKSGGLPVPTTFWVVAAIITVAVWLFRSFMLPRPPVRRAFDEFVLTLPGLGGMAHGFAMAKFGRAFGALYKGGVALPKAVRLACDACDNEAVRAKVMPATDALERGAGVTETLRSTNAFSPLVLDMTRTGETTGNMDEMLVKVSEYYESEGAMKAQVASKIIGVVCLVLVAVYVLFILLSFYGGYFASLMGGAGS
ncbi:MAG: type II secretion system F family protein [Chthonomonadaceae bacterium]|nr:type II secretion system F family protein [Chthonomonadaceae bacterium]